MSIAGNSDSGVGGGAELSAASDSFFEIGQYKSTVKRIEDGLTLCQDMMAMVKERGEIEFNYAKHLQKWAEKWSDHVEKGPEYGTVQSAWKGFFEEAARRQQLHSRIKDRLIGEVHNTIRIWAKDNFHSKALGGMKESKEVEEAFRKAQKPWAKLYAKTEKCRKDYHSACKAHKTALFQESNAERDDSASDEQRRRIHEKVEKYAAETQRTKDVYQSSLRELNNYNGKYMEDMIMVFEKCQDMELKRMKFFKEMLFGVHKCLDIAQDPTLTMIYGDCWQNIDNADLQRDLSYWDHTHGPKMPMNWPVFEDYSPELRKIHRNEQANSGRPAGSSTPDITNYRQRNSPRHGSTADVSAPPPSYGLTNGDHNNQQQQPSPPQYNVSQRFSRGAGDATRQQPALANVGRTPSSADPYDEWGEEAPVKVRALYDYVAQEDDEINLVKDDVFEKLSNVDEQGWCRGRKDGKTGFYPADYAVSVV